MNDSPKPYGPFGRPVKIVITAEPQHFDFLAERFDEVSMVNGRVQALWPHRRRNTSRSDTDLTILHELSCGALKGIPQDEWQIDWEKSELPISPIERLLMKKLRDQLK